MNELLKLLQNNGSDISPEDLAQRIRDMGFDPDNLSSKEIAQLATALMTQTGTLIQSKGGKVGKRKNPKPPVVDLNSIAQTVNREMQSYASTLVAGRDSYIEVKSDELIDIIRDTPNAFIRRLEEKAAEVEDNSEFFRAEGERIVKILFPIG